MNEQRRNVLVSFHVQKKQTRNTNSNPVNTMTKSTKRVLFWAPRLLCILFAAFITLFAMDALEGVHGFWNGAISLGMHLLPTAIIVGLLAIAWRWEWVGAVLFTALGVLYVVSCWGRFHWSVYALIAGQLFVSGMLFLAGWAYRAQLRGGDSA